MRILYFYRGLVRSTQRIHIYGMIRAWRNLGHEVLECFPLSASADGTSATATRVRRLPLLLRNLAQIYADRPARKALERAQHDFQPDFIYERYALFSKCAGDIARRAGIPLVIEVNSAVAHLEPEQVSAIVRPWGRKRELRTLLAAGALVTVSGVQAKRLAALGLPIERIHVTHNAIDPSDYQHLSTYRQRVRSSLGLDSECLFILVQSWENPKSVKGVTEALLQAARLGAEVSSVRLLCVGGGTLLPEVQQNIAHAFPRAIFTGPVAHEEVRHLLAAADAALIPWHEAFTSPLKLFEYMAAGLPVIAPELGGIAEVIRNGENGLLFPPGDGAAIGQAMLLLNRDAAMRERLGQAARRDVLEEHTWENNARKVTNLALALSARRNK